MLEKVPSAKPSFTNISDIVNEMEGVLKSGRLILGSHTEEFENSFAGYVQTEHAVAVSSATAALEMSLRAIGVKQGEVIVPANTFLGCANAVLYAGGKPVFADVDLVHHSITYETIKEKINSHTRAVMAVHMAGIPVPDIFRIKELVKEKGIKLIEDCSHAHGAQLSGIYCGNMSDIACFSFYPTKNMTTGTGGMITTNNEEYASFARSARHFGYEDDLDNFARFGSDWLMDELRAVVGISQLNDLERNVEKRLEIGNKYMEGFEEIEGIDYFVPPNGMRPAYYKFPATLKKGIDKQVFLDKMHAHNIDMASLYALLCYEHPPYVSMGYKRGICPRAEEVVKREVAFPMSNLSCS
jgi:perosamine synthetase